MPLSPSTSQPLNLRAKLDPYATRAHRAIDVLLILFTALLLFIVFRTSPLAHRGFHPSSDDRTAQPQQLPGK